ncbi:MAG: flagellin [Desulfobulbaceae bacterium]|nr:flagellin [Desulfobulbaceae bacterium]
MRTTLNTIYSRINTNLGKITTDMGKINEQISSGMQMSKLSDQPVNLASALRFRTVITELGQFTENIQNGNTIITAAESALTQMKDLALRAKTLAIQATSPGNSAANREAIAEEIKNMHEQAVALANTQVNGKYIFGGYRTTGYPADEPMPFMMDKGDGYWVNGKAPATLSGPLPASSGYQIATGDLTINGIAVLGSSNDTGSDVYADASAEAKAKVVNDIANKTGVKAIIVSAEAKASGPVALGTGILDTGDLIINGVDIFASPTNIIATDTDNTILNAINAKTTQTGLTATRDQNGILQLTAIDGRNIHVETSANGETITQLTGAGSGVAGEQVSFGSLQLRSDRKFIIETSAATDTALTPLGLAGGTATSGEAGDTPNDGKIEVFSIHERSGTVRYAGDRVNDLQIKIGKTNTMTVGENGKSGVMDTTIFSTLKSLEDSLRGNKFTSITGIHSATATNVTLDSNATGLEPETLLAGEALFTAGTFKVSVLDHDTSPPTLTAMTISVDPTVDTLESVTAKINGIPHVSASWTTDGHLSISADNASYPDNPRYTIALTEDGSNFLKATGVSFEFMQNEGINQSLGNLDTLMENLTSQVSDFGSRANRIDIQSQIYSNMILTTKENLSEVQDTDMVKAILELKAKETAYEAALSSASKTMQLSLVDYLR